MYTLHDTLSFVLVFQICDDLSFSLKPLCCHSLRIPITLSPRVHSLAHPSLQVKWSSSLLQRTWYWDRHASSTIARSLPARQRANSRALRSWSNQHWTTKDRGGKKLRLGVEGGVAREASVEACMEAEEVEMYMYR